MSEFENTPFLAAGTFTFTKNNYKGLSPIIPPQGIGFKLAGGKKHPFRAWITLFPNPGAGISILGDKQKQRDSHAPADMKECPWLRIGWATWVSRKG
jgi:hypothetical protein